MIEHNSELLFLYDARLCNPNGDPDEENRPRMDYETGRNLVSDVRLKRYLRDFWLTFDDQAWTHLGYPTAQDIWVRREIEDGRAKTVGAKDRIETLARQFASGKTAKDLKKDPAFPAFLKEHLLDLRLFGATIPIGGRGGGAGGSLTFTGPVQFTWGYSLNRVEILPSSTITSTFSGRDAGEKGQHGTMGKDWRVKYSFLAFWGLVSAFRAKETGMTEQDLDLLDASMFDALPLMATTRSKIGQSPRLYLRVEYRDPYTVLGDFREVLRLSQEEALESIEDVQLKWEGLLDRLQGAKDRIHRVVYRVHASFEDGKRLVEDLKGLIGSDRVHPISSLKGHG